MSVIPLAPVSIEFLPFRPSFHLPLRFNVNSTLPDTPDTHDCRLHLDIALPDALFIDPDEIRDALSSDVEWSLEPETVDIERPVQLDADPSHLYLSLSTSDASGHVFSSPDGLTRMEIKVKVPMHARYLRPSDHARETVWLFADDAPLRGGWVCRADEQHGTLPVVPTMPISVMLPTGKPAHQPLVEVGTMAVVWACTVYLGWKIWQTSTRLSDRRMAKQKTS